MQAKEEWWYPAYMKEKCPGLPNWEALKDPACAEAFSTPETAPNGRYLGGPVTWGGFDEERVEALDLPFEVVHAGTDAALFAELECAYQRQAPIMLWIYSPHWAPAKYEGEWVEFPRLRARTATPTRPGARTPTRRTIAASRAARSGRSAGPGVKDKWPGAYEAIQAFTIDQRRDGRADRQGRPRRPDGRGGRRRLDGGERGPLEGLDREVGWAKRSVPTRCARRPSAHVPRGHGAFCRAFCPPYGSDRR